MARVRLIALALALALVAPPARAELPPCTETASIADTYRQAMEIWRGRAAAERIRRQAAEAEALAQAEGAERWRTTAQAAADRPSLAWLWPTAALVALAAFAGGFALGLHNR
jgi:hypothetical protein